MYKIYADYVRLYDESVGNHVIKENVLIFDSTRDDYKIGKGTISLETNKSGSFTFSLYPDHFCYDGFIRLKSVITVYKSGKIVFRGRILSDVTDHWNNKVITCEGELGFLQDSVIRPFVFADNPKLLFETLIGEHNGQVDEFKYFKTGDVTIADPGNYIGRRNSEYGSTLSNLNSQLIETSLGGYLYITHGEDGTDPIPTLNYLADFTKISTQVVEFGSNLKKYTKTVKANNIATAIIPLGHEVDDGDENTENQRLTIMGIDDLDFVYDPVAVELYGWITKAVIWDDVTDAAILKAKAEEYLANVIQQNITIELNAIDLHLLDHSIESISVGDYVRVISEPHNFDSTFLCNKQTIDLLRPENDTLTLGYTYSTFTETSNKVSSSVSNVVRIQSTVNNLVNHVGVLDKNVSNTEQNANEALENYRNVSNNLGQVSGDLETVAGVVTENARNITINAQNIATNAANISANADDIEKIKTDIVDIIARLEKLETPEEG